MIIQIRGTSGSGKTTVMKNVMQQYNYTPQHVQKRKQPLYYFNDEIIFLGHYESPCGGCDTIGSARHVYELIQELECKNKIIICEGLLLSEDTKWSKQLKDLKVLFLTTPLETCLERIISRRKEAGNDKPLNPNNTTKRVAVIERARTKLVALGVTCRRASSTQAPKIIESWINA